MGTTGNAERGKIEVELKGKTYTLLELDLRELGEIENFVKSKYAKLYRDSAAGVDPEEREKRVMEILRQSYSAEELSEEMNAFDCIYYAAYLMLQYNPGVTLDSMKDIIDQNNIQVISTAMSAFGSDDDDLDPPTADQEMP